MDPVSDERPSLPPSPLAENDFLRSNIWLHDIPEVFLQHALKQLSPSLIDGCRIMVPFPPSPSANKALYQLTAGGPRSLDSSALAPTVHCKVQPGLTFSPASIPPTHFLAFPHRASYLSSLDDHGFQHGNHTLIPIHDLPFALASPVLAALFSPRQSSFQGTPTDDPPTDDRALSAALIDATAVAVSAAVSPYPIQGRSTELEVSTGFASGLPALTPPSPPLSPVEDVFNSPNTTSPQPDPPAPAHPFSSSTSMHIPIIPLAIPHLPSFAILHFFIYSRDTSILVNALFASPSSPRPNSHALFSGITRHDMSPAPADDVTREAQLASMEEEELELCLDRIEKLRELATFLEITDRALWETMHQAWEATVDAIEQRTESDEEED
ncbi:hypothetical protein JCM8547_008498 [Rhodosporidiobolus lusitaniae]